MKAVYILTTYGKKETYISARYVLDEYVEEYKAETIAYYKARDWNKEFHFSETMRPVELTEEYTGIKVLVMTKNGLMTMNVKA